MKINKDNIELLLYMRELVSEIKIPGSFIIKTEVIDNYQYNGSGDVRYSIELSNSMRNKLVNFDNIFGNKIDDYLNNKDIIDRDENFEKLIGIDGK